MARKSQSYSWNLHNRISPRKLLRDYADSHSNTEDYYTSCDNSPMLRHERYKHLLHDTQQDETDDHNISVSTLAKFFLFCIAMIIFFLLMYIPVYSRVYKIPTAIVSGWSVKSNRDTKLYIQPNNITTRHRPLHVCTTNKKLYVLIIVTSATDHFESRATIRQSWGNYNNYVKMSKLYKKVKDKYKNYNFTHDLFKFPEYARYDKKYNKTLRVRRGISYGSLLPNLAAALKDNIENAETDDVPDEDDNRFDDVENVTNYDERLEDDGSDGIIKQFDMNKVLDVDEDYDYRESNVMKIAPNGYQEVPDFGKILSILRHKNPFDVSKNVLEDNKNNINDEVIDYDNFNMQGAKAFKLVFLLGMPADNNSLVQDRIDEESSLYGDILQENFVDSYNNLTLKSIMMLKWVVKNCKDSVRYILKTDDDMFVNVPSLISLLRNKTRAYEALRKTGEKENMLIGFLFYNNKPISNRNSKWYSPTYMYSGKVYPKYLSGTGYLLTLPTAEALYEAALRVQYFHIEDVYITGFCPLVTHPRVYPRHEPNFFYDGEFHHESCLVYSHVVTHHLKRPSLAALVSEFTVAKSVDRCERYRLTKLRHYRMGSKKRKKAMAPNKGLRKIYLKT